MVSRVRDGRLTTSEATAETMLSPGDVVEVNGSGAILLSALDPEPGGAESEPASFVTGASVTP